MAGTLIARPGPNGEAVSAVDQQKTYFDARDHD